MYAFARAHESFVMHNPLLPRLWYDNGMTKRPPRHGHVTAAPTHFVRPKHDPERQARRAMATNSSRWRKLRESVLSRSPLCQCGKPANEVDHIDGDSHNNAFSNLQALCKSCHSRKTATEQNGFGNAKKGGSKI